MSQPKIPVVTKEKHLGIISSYESLIRYILFQVTVNYLEGDYDRALEALKLLAASIPSEGSRREAEAVVRQALARVEAAEDKAEENPLLTSRETLLASVKSEAILEVYKRLITILDREGLLRMKISEKIPVYFYHAPEE